MSSIHLKQCDRCGAKLDANSAFCGNCGKQFNTTGENSLTPPPGELQQRPMTPGFSNPGLYTPPQPGYPSSPSQPGYPSSPTPRSRSNRIYLVMIALLVLMLLGTFVFFLGKESGQGSSGTIPGNQNQSATKPANNDATSSVVIATPTQSTTTPTELTATPDLTATAAGLTLAPAETLPESITLKCDCTDPVVVTITKIVVQPQQNRMIWSLTFFNNSQSGTDASFYQFSLQKGDQINYPTTGEQTYVATGGGINTDVPLQSGETKQATLTFSFVPYKDIPYTLSSELGGMGITPVNFNPAVIQF
jgi:cytoskeletal protein RodZ